MPAPDARGVPFDVAHQRLARRRPFAVAFEHGPPAREVATGIDQQALGLQAIAAGAARFLLIVLERLRRARMHDEPDVGSIDPHAERDRRHHDVDVFVEKRVLVAMPRLVVESRVVRARAHPGGLQPFRQRVDFLPGLAVDDARLPLMP